MTYNSVYIPGETFYYQVGSVYTDKPWHRPSYNRIKALFTDDRILPILNKYLADICGGCLWDMNATWDLDLSFYNRYNSSWEDVESDINTILSVAIKEYKILVDVTVRKKALFLPSKEEILEYFKTNPDTKMPNANGEVVKIGYAKKIVKDSIEEYHIEKTNRKYTKLSSNYLYEVRAEEYKYKITDRILNSYKSNLITNLSYADFIDMGEDTFNRSINY